MNTNVIGSDILDTIEDYNIFGARSFTVLNKSESTMKRVGLNNRLDLLSKSIYGSYNYMSLIYLMNKDIDFINTTHVISYLTTSNISLINNYITAKKS